jgi:hypothetical protein
MAIQRRLKKVVRHRQHNIHFRTNNRSKLHSIECSRLQAYSRHRATIFITPPTKHDDVHIASRGASELEYGVQVSTQPFATFDDGLFRGSHRAGSCLTGPNDDWKKKKKKNWSGQSQLWKRIPETRRHHRGRHRLRMPTDSSTWGGNLVSKGKRTHPGLNS